ncbi:TonB-dependent receptor [Flavisphingomonas formosensis]|uniref:TonB-dependent receptor n=1 Tax=Flavisphingomonas formosensis TaxID=861534 RepID=UPI0012F8F715|nr:TonB-dependent receptor [Sphingomonas formosensis]
MLITSDATSFNSRANRKSRAAINIGLFLCVSVFALNAAQAAQAETLPAIDAVNSDGDIVVTAQKRQERLLDVPMAVTTIPAQVLVNGNVVQAKDYLIAVPGVQINTRQAGRTQINIRGVTSGNGGNPLVGITIDDIPFGSSTVFGGGSSVIPDLDPFILQSVEVLRGPQGTLYGASSMGGLVKFQTMSPSLTDINGALQTGLSGVTGGGGTGYSVRGAVNAPLVHDKLAVSLSAFYRKDPGYISDPSQGVKNQDDLRALGGRVAILGQLSDTFKICLSAIYQKQDQDMSSQMDTTITGQPLYGDLQHVRLPGTDGFHSRVQFYDLILDKEVGDVTLSSLSAYTRTKLANPSDFTLVDGGYAADVTGLPNPGAYFVNNVSTKKFTQEFRITSSDDKPISYIAGVYYGDEKSFLFQDEFAADQATGAIVSPSIYQSNTHSSYREYAAYATLTWKASEQFDIQAGGRYSHSLFKSSEFDTDNTGPIFQADARAKENPFTFSVSPRYHFSTNLMIYARVASGFRAGGANAGLPATIAPTFRSDDLVNYEIGMKGQTDNGRLSGTLATYYIDWSNIQITQRDNAGNSYLTNAGKAKSEGVEASLSAQPLDGLYLSSSLTYSHAVMNEDAPAGTFYGFKGDRLPFSAKWTATLGGEYRMPVGAKTSVFLAGNLLYTGQRLSDFVANSTQTRFNLPSFTTADLRIGADVGNVTATLFVRNVGDSRGFVSGRPLRSRARDPIAVSVITPRTIGASLSVKL